MPFSAKIFRVLIASPSDLSEERQAATDAINDWNAQHADVEHVVLLPVKWETHALPEYGGRPQAAINRQLVQECDILVGMFWTKIGSPTGVAESGTVEEIDQFVAAGKPTLLYFSHKPIDPTTINTTQLEKLLTFRATTYEQALVGKFNSPDGLRNTLSQDLTRQVRHLKNDIGSEENMPNSREAEAGFAITEIPRMDRHLLNEHLGTREIEEELAKRPSNAVFWGTTHSELIPGAQAKLREQIQRGLKLQVILIAPSDCLKRMAGFRALPNASTLGASQIADAHQSTERILAGMRLRQGSGEVRYYRLNYLPSFTLVGFDLDSGHGVIYIRFAELESHSEIRPTVKFSAEQDSVWYAHFRDQWLKALGVANEARFNDSPTNPDWLPDEWG